MLIHRSKIFCLATCASFVVSIFAAQAHRAVFVHGYCSDHGAVIHLSWKAAHLPGEHSTNPGLHGHRHVTGGHGCLAQAFLLSSWIRPRPASLSLAVSRTTRIRALRRELTTCHIPLLHQAPKLPPPRGRALSRQHA